MTPSDWAALRTDVTEAEDKRLRMYKDSVGKWTIGIGHNIEDRGISERVCAVMFQEDLDDAYMELHAFPWFVTLDGVRAAALVELCFNMGMPTLRGFEKMLGHLSRKNYRGAAFELSDSKWARQVGKVRRNRLVTMLEQGRRP